MENLSSRVQSMNYSQTLAMSAKARQLKEQGHDVISLAIGEPDFRPPEFVLNAAKVAMDSNYHGYPPVSGYLDLKEVICHKFKRDNELHYDPSQIVVSTGAKQSIMNLFLALLDEGDEIIIPSPYWVSYYEMAKFAGGKPIIIKGTLENDFKITPYDLEKAISPKTKAFIFSSPCNPTGSVYSFEELKALVEVFKKYPYLIIISDEIYEHIRYGVDHVSIASFKQVYNQVVTINGLSKAFAMTGWRVGYMGAPVWLAKACEKIQGQMTSGANSIAQRAAIAALQSDPIKINYMVEAFRKRRDLVIDLIKEIPGFEANIPKGAFYVFVDVSKLLAKEAIQNIINEERTRQKSNLESSSVDVLANSILEKAHVALVGGSAFGEDKALRISYALSEDRLKEAFERIKKIFL